MAKKRHHMTKHQYEAYKKTRRNTRIPSINDELDRQIQPKTRKKRDGSMKRQLREIQKFSEVSLDTEEYDDYDDYQDRFRSHYNATYGTKGYSYGYYEPAYRYGYDLATSERYGRRDWGEVEIEARDLWEDRNEGTWDRFKDAVEHAWHEVKEGLGMEEDEGIIPQSRQFS